jgi:hypothetical protein
MMFIKIINNEKHFAQNKPTGIVIHTGTRYFAATLLQEYYEFWRYAFWFWVVPVIISVAAGAVLGLPYALIGTAVMALVAFGFLPFNLHERELTGQAIEIAAIEKFYGRKDMESEYRLQARSMIRKDHSYKLRGFWPDIPAINPDEYTNEMAFAGKPHPSIDAMIVLLKSKSAFAEGYVQKHQAKLIKWKPLGAGDCGY